MKLEIINISKQFVADFSNFEKKSFERNAVRKKSLQKMLRISTREIHRNVYGACAANEEIVERYFRAAVRSAKIHYEQFGLGHLFYCIAKAFAA